MKTYKLSTLFLIVILAALLANTLRLLSNLAELDREKWLERRKVALLQVQLMDQVIDQKQTQNVAQLLDNPEEWLAPLKEKINADPKLAQILKSIGFNDGDVVVIYCNPVDDSPEPYEMFFFTFSADKCVRIKRRALCPW